MKVLNTCKRQSFSNVILIVFGIPLLFLFSCDSNSTRDKDNPVVAVEDIEVVNFDELFVETGKTVQLESGEDIMLGAGLYFNFFKDNIYILDRSRKNLLRFHKDGGFLNRIGRQGKGPEEYLRIANFFVNDVGVTVFFNAGTTVKLQTYDHNGNFVHLVELENYVALDLEKQGDHYQVFTSHNKFMHDHRLYQLNANFKITGQFLENNFTGNPLTVSEHNFVRMKDRLFLRESAQAVIYEITKDAVTPVYQFDFGKYKIPDDFWAKDGIEGFELIMNRGVAFTRYFLQGDRYALIVVLFQKNGEVARYNYIVHDKVNDKYKMAILKESDDTFVFRDPVGVGDNNEFLFKGFEQLGVSGSIKFEDGMEIKNPAIKYYKIAQ